MIYILCCGGRQAGRQASLPPNRYCHLILISCQQTLQSNWRLPWRSRQTAPLGGVHQAEGANTRAMAKTVNLRPGGPEPHPHTTPHHTPLLQSRQLADPQANTSHEPQHSWVRVALRTSEVAHCLTYCHKLKPVVYADSEIGLND